MLVSSTLVLVLVLAIGWPAGAVDMGTLVEVSPPEPWLTLCLDYAHHAMAQVTRQRQTIESLPEEIQAWEQAGIAAHDRERDQVRVLASALVQGASRWEIERLNQTLEQLRTAFEECNLLFAELMADPAGDGEDDLPPGIPV